VFLRLPLEAAGTGARAETHYTEARECTFMRPVIPESHSGSPSASDPMM